jgi:hypothetical protein
MATRYVHDSRPLAGCYQLQWLQILDHAASEETASLPGTICAVLQMAFDFGDFIFLKDHARPRMDPFVS